MKKLVIPETTYNMYYEELSYQGGLVDKDEGMQKWIDNKLAAAGFDMARPVEEKKDITTRDLIFTQEG